MALAKYHEDILEAKDENKMLNGKPQPAVQSFWSKVVVPKRYKNGYVKYNPTKKRVEIYVEGDISEEARRALDGWNYHPKKLFWSRTCSAKKKIKAYFSFAAEILE